MKANKWYPRQMGRAVDVTSTMRFAGVPNRCELEMFELTKPRKEASVSVCIVDPQGGKHMAEFVPQGG